LNTSTRIIPAALLLRTRTR